MEQQTKDNVLEILSFWKLTEFLTQDDFPVESHEMKRKKKDMLSGKNANLECFDIYTDISDPTVKIEKMLLNHDDQYPDYQIKGDEIYYCIGTTPRNECVDFLSRIIPQNFELPELAYSSSKQIAWFSFKTDISGIYIKNSFQLSPIIWALNSWINHNNNRNQQIRLDIEAYEKSVTEIDQRLESIEDLHLFLHSIYSEIYKNYIHNLFPNLTPTQIGICIYSRYRNEDAKTKNPNHPDLSNLGKSYFLNDIDLIHTAIKTGIFGEKSEFEKAIINYILSEYRKSKGMRLKNRINISPQEPQLDMLENFKQIFRVSSSPIGKWPSKFMPGLMQQAAINLSINHKKNLPLFSVNGPPGTGKTTLLKEIIADTIVKRAKCIAELIEKDPDEAFIKQSFSQGPLDSKGYFKFAPNYYKLKFDELNQFSILVASCNNAAVENITLELPCKEDLLCSLQADNNDDDSLNNNLKEIYSLFNASNELQSSNKEHDLEHRTEHFFFSNYATELSGESAWGLISAPIGKKENIRKYCEKVLQRLLIDFNLNKTKEIHKLQYQIQRTAFLNQLNLVSSLQDEILLYCEQNTEAVILDNNLNSRYKKFVMTPLGLDFIAQYSSSNQTISTTAQIANPWLTEIYNREREKLFYHACKLHEEFVISSKSISQNIHNLLISWNQHRDCQERLTEKDRNDSFSILMQTVFLLTPVLSTTFASTQTLFADIKKPGVFGTLIIDEAGQAQPHMALGSMFRCRSAIVVGDPKQIEPIVKPETNMITQLISSPLLAPYKSKHISVQSFADFINPIGTYLGEDEEREWVGCPLVVHRRCIDPMFSISNTLSYSGTMKQQARIPKKDLSDMFILERSCWINVIGTEASGTKNRYVPQQGDIVLRLLQEKFRKEDIEKKSTKLFIITPFTTVKWGIIDTITSSEQAKTDQRYKDLIKMEMIGTVHTFQGQEADEVIFLLGCDKKSYGAANWVNKNIVNVAVTRAKYRIYIIGDKEVWTCNPVKIARDVISHEISIAELDSLLSPKTQIPESNSNNSLLDKILDIPDEVFLDLEEIKTKTTITCPKCGCEMKERIGKFGSFLGCSAYPQCKFTSKKL